MPVHVSSYIEGMDRDSSKNKYNPNAYYKIRNMRLTSFEELSNVGVQSIKGNTYKIGSPSGYEDYFVIGYCSIRDYLVVFSTNNHDDNGGAGAIFYTKLSHQTPSWTLVYSNPSLLFSTKHPIQKEAIGYYEADSTIKIYWTDNYNMLRYINILDSENYLKPVHKLDIRSEVTLATPEYVSIGSGSIQVGMIQYAYQYYDIGGTETIFSPCTPLIHLVRASENASGSNIKDYTGISSLDDSGTPNISGKSVTIRLSDVDFNYDMVRVVAILYRNLDQEPEIKVVGEYNIADNLQIIDFGVYNKGSISFNALRTLGNPELYCKSISQKGSKALLGNITEKFFDVDYDARAYRFGPVVGEVKQACSYTYDATAIDNSPTTKMKLVFDQATDLLQSLKTNDKQGETGTVRSLSFNYTEVVSGTEDSAVAWALDDYSAYGYSIQLEYVGQDSLLMIINGFTAFARARMGLSASRVITSINNVPDPIVIHGFYNSSTLGDNSEFQDDFAVGTFAWYMSDRLAINITNSNPATDYFTSIYNWGPGDNDGDGFVDNQTVITFRVNYSWEETYNYSYSTSDHTDLIYNPLNALVPDNPTWEFEVTRSDGYAFINCINPFDVSNLTDFSIVIDSYYYYTTLSGTPRIKVYNSKANREEDILTDVTDNAWPNTTYLLQDPDTGLPASIPEDHDCINPYNFDFLYGAELPAPTITPCIDEVATYCDATDFALNPLTNEPNNANQYKWMSDMTTLGGEGPNVKYEFVHSKMTINKSTDPRFTEPDIVEINDLRFFDSHKNPFRSAYLMNYKHDEVYRHGLVAVNAKGQESFVKWIGDIKTPTLKELPTTTPRSHIDIAHNSYNVPFEVVVTTISGHLNATIDTYQEASAVATQRTKMYFTGLDGTMRVDIYESGVLVLTNTISFLNDLPTTVDTYDTLYTASFSAAGYTIFDAVEENISDAYPVGIKFYVNTVPLVAAGAVGFKIVRVERKREDRSIYSQGIVSSMFLQTGNSTPNTKKYENYILGFTRATVKEPTEGTNTTYYTKVGNVVQFISPDINLFKDLSPLSSDYIKMQAKLPYRHSYLSFNYNNVVHSITTSGVDERAALFGSGVTYASSFFTRPWMNYSRYSSMSKLSTLNVYKVTDGTIAGLVEEAGIEENEIVLPSSPDGRKILNRSADFASPAVSYVLEHEGISGTSAVLVIDDDINISELTSLDEHELFVVDYKKGNIAASQYGGITYEARQNNIYISCGDYVKIETDTETVDIYGGDTYIDYFTHMKTMWEAQDLNGDNVYDIDYSCRYSACLSIPVESHINLGLMYGALWDRYYTSYSIYGLREEAGTYDVDRKHNDVTETKQLLVQEENMYLYNPVFSQQDTTKIFVMEPDNWEAVVHDDCLTKISLEKTVREEVDSYLKFLTDNEKLLPTEYGPINKLFLFKNYMLVFMDNAIGTLSIDERALLPIQNNSILELGAGQNLQHFEFIANKSGSVHPESVEYSGNGFIWYDANRGSLGYYNGDAQDIGFAKGMSSVFNSYSNLIRKTDGSYHNNQFSGGNVLCTENEKYKETLIACTVSDLASIMEIVDIDTIIYKYGALYNWYAATDVREITSSDDWGVSDHLDFKTLSDYLGGNAAAGGKLKETGFTYWNSPNSGATNEVGLNVKGGGYRKYDDGTFSGLGATFRFWNNGELAGAGRTSWINYDDTTFWTYDGITSYINHKKMGAYIRLVRPATVAEQLLDDGTACDPYTGNDGKIYRTVKIGTQVWLADNLCETKYRNGDSITVVTDNAAWAALTTPAMCYYENNPVYSHTVVSTDKSLRFGLGIGKSPGNYSDAKVVVNGTEYIAHTITKQSDGSGEILINDVDNPGLNLTLAVWSDEYYHVYYKDLSNVYSFSTINNAFAFEVDIIPTHLIKQNGELFSLHGRHNIWKENVGNYAQFYNIYRDGEIEYIINPKLSVVCLFNNFEYAMEAFNSSGENLINETWDTVRLQNDYQYSASKGDICTFGTITNLVGTGGIGHGLTTGDLVMFSGASLPPEITNTSMYYVINPSSAQFQITDIMDGVPIIFSTNTTGLYHKIDIPLITIGSLVNDKRRMRTWRIKDPRNMKGYESGIFRPRMRDSYLRMLLKYNHGDNKRIIMHDLYTYYTFTKEVYGNNK